MKIVFVLKGTLDILPPLLPRLLMFGDQTDFEVSMVCTSVNEYYRNLLDAHHVNIYQTEHCNALFGRHSRILDWYFFRQSVFKLINDNGLSNAVLYICSGDTAMALGKKLTQHAYILQSNELYDQAYLYKIGLKPLMLRAMAVIVPEYHRANVFASWYRLRKLPYIIPNYPFLPNIGREQTITDQNAAHLIESLKGKKIILYQGHIARGERSIDGVAKALHKMNREDLALVLLGESNDGSYKDIQEIYEYTYFIPHIKAPRHLEITSHAYIGILSYDRISLNNIFCAPNKLYEYSAFDMPMLGNDIPGLKDAIDRYELGCCVDFDDITAVEKAILKIDADYSRFSLHSNAFFKNSSYHSEMQRLMNEIRGMNGIN